MFRGKTDILLIDNMITLMFCGGRHVQLQTDNICSAIIDPPCDMTTAVVSHMG